MKSRIFVKLFAAALLIIAVCALTMNVLIQKAWVDMLRSEIETSLRQKTLLFASRIEEHSPRFHSQGYDRRSGHCWAPGPRSSIAPATVLADSEATPKPWKTTPPGRNSLPP